jgi:hypothetical protein
LGQALTTRTDELGLGLTTYELTTDD